MVGGNRMVAKMNTLKNKMTNTREKEKKITLLGYPYGFDKNGRYEYDIKGNKVYSKLKKDTKSQVGIHLAKMTNTTQLKKGFRIEFSDIVFEKAYGGRDARDMVWSFIEQALTQQREEIVKAIKIAEKAGDQYGTLYELLKEIK
jgi:thiamine kinase-like enzyme